MQEVEITWGRAIKVWWSIMWRGSVYGFIAGFVAIFTVGEILTVSELETWGVPISIIAGIPAWMWAVKTVLAKSYSDFRVALLVPHGIRQFPFDNPS